MLGDVAAALSSYSGIAPVYLGTAEWQKIVGDRDTLDQILRIMAPEGIDKLSAEERRELDFSIRVLTGDPTGLTALPAIIKAAKDGSPSAILQAVAIFTRIKGLGSLGKLLGKDEAARKGGQTSTGNDATGSTPVGRRTGYSGTEPDGVQTDGSGRQTPQWENGNSQPNINKSTTIGNRNYSGHALDQMQNRGVTPSVVEHTIETGTPIQGNRPGTTEYVDRINGVNVVVNSDGRVVTVK